MSRRFKGRPINGLPGQLPPGETIIWQAAPRWQTLAVRCFRVKWVAAYFALLVAWRVGGALLNGRGADFAIGSGLKGLCLGAAAIGIFTAYAWLISRTTSYTITDKRVVITYGMALPKSLNLPFAQIQAADLAVTPDGTGNIVLHLPAKHKLSYLLLWPHVQAGEKSRPEPVLRALVEPQAVARLLGKLLAASVGADERAVVVTAPAELPQLQGIAA